MLNISSAIKRMGPQLVPRGMGKESTIVWIALTEEKDIVSEYI